MNVRIATKNDLPGILNIYKELNPEDNELDLCKAETIWNKIESKNTTLYLVAIENQVIVGTCNISIIENLTRNGMPYGIIENVITSINYRRKGIGKKLIEKAVELTKNSNCYKME